MKISAVAFTVSLQKNLFPNPRFSFREVCVLVEEYFSVILTNHVIQDIDI